MNNPKRTGCSAERAGRLFLINDEEKRYEVSHMVGLLWRVCDGTKSVDELAHFISQNARNFHMNRPRLRNTIFKALKDLKRRELVRYC